MLNEVNRDIWTYHADGNYVVIPTNGTVKKNGEAVMGRGLAFQAAWRFSNLSQVLGTHLLSGGNNVYAFPAYRLITFPVKHHWHEAADLELIEKSFQQLVPKANQLGKFPVVLPRVGCGNGRLLWENVRPVAERYLNDNFVVTYSFEHDGRDSNPRISPIA